MVDYMIIKCLYFSTDYGYFCPQITQISQIIFSDESVQRTDYLLPIT